MLSILFIFLLLLVITIALFCIKKTFSISASLEISSSLADIQEKIVDFSTWQQWSPWLLHEPDTQIVLSEDYTKEAGWYQWDGKYVGSGKVQHHKIELGYIAQNLTFIKPFKSTAKTYWRIEPNQNNSHTVIWSMDSQMPLAMAFMIPMLKVGIANDYKIGLLRLAQLLSDKAEPFQFQILGEQNIAAIAGVADSIKNSAFTDLGPFMATTYAKLNKQITEKNGRVTVPAMASYSNVNFKKMSCDCTCIIPTDLKKEPNEHSTLPGQYFRFQFTGDYQYMKLAWYMAYTHLRMIKRKTNNKAPALEIYQQMKSSTEGTLAVTELLIAVK